MNIPVAAIRVRQSHGGLKLEMSADQSPVPESAEYRRRPEPIRLTQPKTHRKYHPVAEALVNADEEGCDAAQNESGESSAGTCESHWGVDRSEDW